MSKPKGFEKPSGVIDYLPETVNKLRNIEFNVLACMEKWGYRQIITPTFEFYDTVGVASATSDKKLFKLLDRNGTTVVLRSDMTAPIARVAASLLKDNSLPFRVSYHANVFRAFEEEGGRGAEFFQTGVELIGDASPEADAEVVALAIASLQAAGVTEFKIALGHVGFINALFHDALADQVDAQMDLKRCLLHRDYVGYQKIISGLEIAAQLRNELIDLLALRGKEEVCERALKLTSDIKAQEAIKHLCHVWGVLQAYEVTDHVMIDLTMIGDFSYYTGMTFEGYAANLGFPVCSGGRYDNLLAQFGRPAPATGFALKTNRMIGVITEDSKHPPQRTLIIYDEAHRKEALQLAKQMRLQNKVMIETKKISDTESDEIVSNQDGMYHVQGNVYDNVLKVI